MICVSYTRTMSCILMEETPSDIIARQNKHIAEYVSARKWKIEKKYSDRRKDRNDDSAFREMKEDGISGKFDLVIMDSVYRFGISFCHAYDLLALVFVPAEIHFAVAEDNFCSLDCSKEETMLYLQKKKSEYRSIHTKETVGRKLEKRIYEKYGYFHKDGVMELVIDEKAAPTIRKVFSLVCEGYTLKETADILNNDGYVPPHISRKKRGVDGRFADGELWLPSQIRNIVINPLYMGEWHRTIACKKVIVPCPPIVSEEVFRKANQLCVERRNGAKSDFKTSENMLSGIFYDYDTGTPIHQYRNQTSGEKVFRLQYPKPPHIDYPKMLISYNEVEATVRSMLKKEQEKAKLVLSMLDTAEFATYKQKRLEPLYDEAQKAFEIMKDTEYRYRQESCMTADEIVSVQRKNDEILQHALSKIEKIENLLSANNPWVGLYANMKLPDKLTSTYMRKYIIRASCEKFEKVRIEIKEKEAFSQFPQIWFKEE